MRLNPHSNGDVWEQDRDGRDVVCLGRIDTDGDWCPVDACPYSYSEIRRELARMIDSDDYPDWVWPPEQVNFAFPWTGSKKGNQK